MAKKEYTLEEALLRLQEKCGSSEQCISEVKLKLKQWNIPAEYWEKIIEQLKEDRFVDELRYAKAFVNDKYRLSKWGELKIKNALYLKKIPASIISEALKELESEDVESELFSLLSKKLKSIKSISPSDTFSKLMRFGLARGFPYDIVYKLAKKISEENDD